MKRKFTFWVTLSMSTLLSSAAYAQSSNSGWPDWLHQLWMSLWGQYNNSGGGNSVPELDVAMGPLAIALLAGVIGIAIERKRRKLNRS